MYFASYNYEGKENYGVLNKDKTKILPMDLLLGRLKKECPPTLREFIETYSDDLVGELESILSIFDNEGVSLASVKLNAPTPYTRRNVFCVGKNYVDHAMEVKGLTSGDTDIPDNPIFFSKIADPAIGNGDYILYPEGITSQLDYEVELAIIMARDGKDILPEDVYSFIFGYTIANDISARDVQFRHIQWFKGKNMDTFLPMGPYLVHKSVIDYPVKLDIECKVNNELRQKSNTSKLIFDIPYIISLLSQNFTLKAGDIILSGTPAGVGAGFNPTKFLKAGDVVECKIEGIGVLRNSVK